MTWQTMTPEQKIDAVLSVAQPDWSASQIAKALGITRYAVIGLAHRNKGRIKLQSPAGTDLVNKQNRLRRRKVFRQKLARKTFERDAIIEPGPKLRPGLSLPILSSPAWEPLAGTTPVLLVDRDEKHGCRWPVTVDGKTLYCNCAIPDDRKFRYCDQHLALYRIGK